MEKRFNSKGQRFLISEEDVNKIQNNLDLGKETYILQDYCMRSGGVKYHNAAIDILKRSIGENYII